MAKLTDLPPEIIREIARNIEIPRTLSSASLTCKHLQNAFQERLFSRLHRLSADAICVLPPHLCRYIQSFSISISSIGEVLDLQSVLSKATNIRRLLIMEEGISTEPLFEGYEEELEDNTSKLSKLHLVEVHLHNLFFTLPLSAFKKCRELKFLSFTEHFSEWVPLSLLEPEEEPLVQLETLQLVFKKYTNENVVDWLLKPSCPFAHWKLRKRCAQVLETIRMNIGCPPPEDIEWYPLAPETAEDFQLLDFSIFPNLHTVQIRTELHNNVDGIIRHAFRNVPQDTPIRTVILDLIVNTEQILDGVNVDWIPAIFASDRFTNGLRVIPVFYHIIFDSGPDGEEFIKKINLHCYKNIEAKTCAEETSGPFLYFQTAVPDENGFVFPSY